MSVDARCVGVHRERLREVVRGHIAPQLCYVMRARRWVERDLVRPRGDDRQIVAGGVGVRAAGVVERTTREARIDHFDVHVREGGASAAITYVPGDPESGRETRVGPGAIRSRVDVVSLFE